MTPLPLNGLIYGSCVSRDLARIDDQRFTAGYYLARQSWISGYAPPRPVPAVALKSRFQTRMVEGDFGSTARAVLASTRPASFDVVMLDLIDERLGVIPYEGSWITRSNELEKTKLVPDSTLEQAVPFGSAEHFAMWDEAAAQVREALSPHLSKTFVLAARFADRTAEGNDLRPFRGEPADVWNRRYNRYYDRLADLGFAVIDQPVELVIASEAHMWGATPFHYTDDAYFALGDAIAARLSTR